MASRILLSRCAPRTLLTRALATSSASPRSASASASVAATRTAGPASPPGAGSGMRMAKALATGVAVAAGGFGVAYASSNEQDPNAGPGAGAGADVVAASVTKEEIAGAAAAIEDLLDNAEDDGLGPTLVRLAWHASGTFDKDSGTGGSDGATMRFKPESDHGANAGLSVARDALEPIKKLFPTISYSDLWTLAGAVAIEYMGGPKIVWRPGRRDAADAKACTPDGRLPDADKGKIGATIRHIRSIFSRQGFADGETVALIGAHALGRCHTDRSGYTGPWTRAPTTFSNLFFKELTENQWTLKQWDGPDQFEDVSGELMMLPSDMALLFDKEFRKYVIAFAKNEELFFEEFAKAFQKLEENGVKAFQKEDPTAKSWFKFW